MKRFLCILLVLLILPVWAVACTPSTPPVEGNEGDTNVSDLTGEDRLVIVNNGTSSYRVIRPEKGFKSSALSAGNLVALIEEKCGVEIGLAMDDEAATEYEILIGDTNRPESAAAMAALTDTNFSITVSGNKVVVAAKNDLMLDCAVSYFFKNFVDTVPAVEGVFSFAKDMNYVSSTDYIVFDKPADGNYMVTYPNSEKEYQVLASYGEGTLYNLEYYAKSIYEFLKASKTAGVVLASDKLFGATEPKEEWREILVGGTTRAATKEAKADLDFNEYTIRVIGNDVVVTGLGYVTTKAAAEKFIELIDLFKDDSGANPVYRLPADFCYTTTVSGYERWPEAPEYTDGVLDSVTDAGKDSYGAVYTETTKEAYSAYLSTLEGAGFTKYFENDMNGNLYAIYKTESVIVNAYFFPYSSSVYLVVENAYKITLPALESENVYTDKGVQCSVTQLKMNNVTDSNGQCHVFQLSDGRFIIVDGGGDDTRDGKSDADNLLALLKRLSGNEKPVVAAWFITHLHSDHYSVLLKFAKNFVNEVTVENFIYNFPPSDMVNGDTTKTEQNVEKAMKMFKDSKLIRAHTGQKYYFANAEIEMLFAPELICPNYVTFYNDTSTVFSVTIEGTKTLITGDASPNTSVIMCNMYKEYLQCDILQISHHGSYGCSVEYYTYTNPTKLAFLPVGITQQRRLTAEKENVFVKGLVPIVPHYQGTYTYKLPATK